MEHDVSTHHNRPDPGHEITATALHGNDATSSRMDLTTASLNDRDLSGEIGRLRRRLRSSSEEIERQWGALARARSDLRQTDAARVQALREIQALRGEIATL